MYVSQTGRMSKIKELMAWLALRPRREGPGPDLSAWLVVGYLLSVTLHSVSQHPPSPHAPLSSQYTSVSKIPLFIRTPVTLV